LIFNGQWVYLLVTGGIRGAVEGGAVTILLEMLYGLLSDVITERGEFLFFLVFNLAPDEILRKMLLMVDR
jgi:hypothetical protein